MLAREVFGVNLRLLVNKPATFFFEFSCQIIYIFKKLLPSLTTAWHSRNQRPMPKVFSYFFAKLEFDKDIQA